VGYQDNSGEGTVGGVSWSTVGVADLLLVRHDSFSFARILFSPTSVKRRVRAAASGEGTIVVMNLRRGDVMGLKFSAGSGDIFGNRQMLVVRTVKGNTDAICQFTGGEQAVGFYHPSLAVYPLRLYRTLATGSFSAAGSL